MYKHVLESLGEYQDNKFFFHITEAFGEEEEKPKKKKKLDPMQKDTQDILNHVSKNWDSFKRDAKDDVKTWKSFWDILQACKKDLGSKYGVVECYSLYGGKDSNGNAKANDLFKVASIRDSGKTKLVLFDLEGNEAVVVPDSKASDKFVEWFRNIKKEFIEAKNNYVKKAAEEKQKAELERRKETIAKLGQASKVQSTKKAEPANESSDEEEDKINESFDAVYNELLNKGYNEQEADFIMGEYDGRVPEDGNFDPIEFADELEDAVMTGLTESINEGSYDDFVFGRAEEINHAVKTLEGIQKAINDGDISEDELVKNLERIEDIYDGEVISFIDDKLFGRPGRISPREIADVALSITNNHGTEMQMVLHAIADLEHLAPDLYDEEY